MPAPTNYPDWGTDQTNNVDPPGAKKAAGWVPGEQPPSGWFNWWQWVVGLWVRWLDTLTTQHETKITTLQTDLDALEAGHTTLAADAARTGIANTFTQPQTINASATEPDTPLLTTTQLPSGYPANTANLWKVELAFPTDASCWVGFFVGQTTKRFALAYNARWHLDTQRWRQLDATRNSYALVLRDDRYVLSKVAAGTAPWADWPEAAVGGDLYVGGAVFTGVDFRISSATGEYNFTTPRAHSDWTIPLSDSSGETFLQSDGSYKVGPDGASWPLKVPDGTVLTNIYVIVEHATGASGIAALVRRNRGNLLLPTTWPTQEIVASSPLVLASGVQLLQIGCDGHLVDGAWEYSVKFNRADPNDKVGRIALGTFNEKGIRNYG